MKKLGIWSGMLLLIVLPGLLFSASAAIPRGIGRKRSGPPLPDGRNAPAPTSVADHPERGDVPGWVMITLMSAVLVAALLALAGPALETMFNQAMDKVGS